jgi:hypothetical protein
MECSWGPWGPWTACFYEGTCEPGEREREERSCGGCDYQWREAACSSACSWLSWGDWGECVTRTDCAPGDTRDSLSCDACEHQVCLSDCSWGTCQLKPAAECRYGAGLNWRCCGPGKGELCLGPELGCVWSDQCVSCVDCGCP